MHGAADVIRYHRETPDSPKPGWNQRYALQLCKLPGFSRLRPQRIGLSPTQVQADYTEEVSMKKKVDMVEKLKEPESKNEGSWRFLDDSGVYFLFIGFILNKMELIRVYSILVFVHNNHVIFTSSSAISHSQTPI